MYGSLLSVLLYSSVAVFAIVDGQPTTVRPMDDSLHSQDVIERLLNTADKLEQKLAMAMSKIATLEAALPSKKPATSEDLQIGTSYIRWGRKTCGGNASLVYKGSTPAVGLFYVSNRKTWRRCNLKHDPPRRTSEPKLVNWFYRFHGANSKGYAAGPQYHVSGNSGGGGSNYLCLPEDPQWNTYLNGDQTFGLLVGVEYELFNSGRYHNNIFSESNNGGSPLLDNPMPCAVCYVGGRSTVLMIPAKTQCPHGWTTEYSGYLMSSTAHYSHTVTEYICTDESPEVAVGGTAQNQAVIYPVVVGCGSLPCSVYVTGRELTCVVCSK